MRQQEPVVVFRDGNRVRLDRAQAELEAAGIAVACRALTDPKGARWGAWDSPWATGELVVAADDADYARKILEDLEHILGWEEERRLPRHLLSPEPDPDTSDDS